MIGLPPILQITLPLSSIAQETNTFAAKSEFVTEEAQSCPVYMDHPIYMDFFFFKLQGGRSV